MRLRSQGPVRASGGPAPAAPSAIIEEGGGHGHAAAAAAEDSLIKRCKDAFSFVEYQKDGGLLRDSLGVILAAVVDWRQLMQIDNLNATQLAKLLGRDRATIARWEKIADSPYLQVRV